MEITDFCKDYIASGAQIAGLAQWFLWGAVAMAGLAMIVEFIKQLRAPPAKAAGATPQGVPMIDAITGLVTAVTAAPLWLALFAVGMVVFWVPGNAVSGACAPKPPEKSEKTPDAKPTPQPSSTASGTGH